MDHLWSPWRYRYVSTGVPKDQCIFCAKLQANKDDENYILLRAEFNFILLNLYPYSTGHMMIAPYAHVSTLTGVDPKARAEMMELTARAEDALQRVYSPAGMNVGINLGEAAGAGVAGHIHVHILPRWFGDSSFMTAVAETRVLPEELETTYRKLRVTFQL